MLNKQTPEIMSTSKFSIVRSIAALLKLGNDGKLDSFLTRVVKTLNKEVTIITKNIDTVKFNFSQRLSELQDQLDDAKDALENAYLEVNIDRIGTNEAQTSYVEVYLDNIDRKAKDVSIIEKRIKTETEENEKELKDLTAQVESLNKRVAIISAS